MPKIRRPRQYPTELAWLRSQGAEVSHLTFFNHFTSYSHRKALNRFNIVIDAVENEDVKNKIKDAFDNWKNSRAAKQYWSAREQASQVEDVVASSPNPSASSLSHSQTNSASSSSHSSGASSLTSVETITLPQAKDLIASSNNLNETIDVTAQDIPSCLTRFKQSVFSSLDTSLLTMETHLQHILSLSNIFMLGKHRSHPEFNSFMKLNIKDIRKGLYNTLNYNAAQTKFPKDKREAITDILNQLNAETIKKSAAANMISTYIDDDTDPITEKLIMCIKAYVESLPYETQTKPVQEFELCTRYLQRFFQSLFDEENNGEDDNNFIFKWIDTITFNHTGDKFITRDRPDGCVENDSKTIGYIEVKTIKSAKHHFKINLDLHRLAVYARTAMKKYQLKHVFQVMAIGSHVQFFISQRHGDNVISTVELDCFKLPMSLDELPSLLPFMDRLYNVLEVIQNKCFNESNVDLSCESFSSSLEPRVLKAIVNRRTDRSRENCFFHPYM